MDDYYIGLDIGTNSVGWACVDQNYNLCRYKGQHMWGTRLISDVDTAAERKLYRNNRRTLERRKERLRLLQQILGPSIIKEDPNFFRRLEYSFLIPDEISKQRFGKENVNILFNDSNYTDSDYFKKYPTIYHLRHAMINSDKKFDIREIFLVLHHMIKYRGNFLYEGTDSFNDSLDLAKNIKDVFNFEYYIEDIGESKLLSITDKQINQIIDIIKNDDIPKCIFIKNKNNKLTKEESIIKYLSDDKNATINKLGLKKISNIVKAILGYKFNFNDIIEIEDAQDNLDLLTIKFDDSYVENKDNICEILNDDCVRLLDLLEICYTSFSLRNIIKESNFICDAKIRTYNEHKQDLALLKKYIKGICNTIGSFDLYNAIFRDVLSYKNNDILGKIGCTYSMYVKNQQNVKHKGQLFPSGSRELFYTFIKNIINIHVAKDKKIVKLFEDNFSIDLSKLIDIDNVGLLNDANIILDKIEKATFMPKLNDVSNSLLPYQLNLKEMQIILDKQSNYYSVLKNNSKKIISIFTHNRPYYIGVLNPNSPYSWAKDDNGNPLTPNEKIYPWNFDKLINKEEFANQFMKRLVGKCSYFEDEDVLCKKAIRYQALCTLNELNKLRITAPGSKRFNLIDSQLKIYLFNKLFLTYKKVSIKRLIAELKNYDSIRYSNITENDIKGIAKLKEKGIDAEFDNGMSTYIEFKRIFGDQFDIKYIDEYDEIVKIIAIFKNKEIIKSRISKFTKIKVSDKQIKALSSLNLEGWGKYSKKFLDEIVDKNGKTVLEELYYGKYNKGPEKCVCYNLDELVYDKLLGFKEQVLGTEANCKLKFNYEEHISNLYCSPSVKSIIWQAISIVEEIAKITKKAPSKIFIESTREDSLKMQSISRFEHLKMLYQRVMKKEDAKELYEELICNESRINAFNDKLYLYFSQMGKCMYTKERLSLANLNEYEIDHIIPRCLIKDDSFSNRVLVKKIENQRKGGTFLLDNKIVSNCSPWWEHLREQGFISNQKYKSLTRKAYSDSDYETFINRQLVETNQIIKVFRKVAALKYPIENIVGVKASLISQLRVEQMLEGAPGFAKIRGLNDMHHAKDAYLAAALGDFLQSEFDGNGAFEQIKYDLETKAFNTRELNNYINKRNGYVLDTFKYGDVCDDGIYGTGTDVSSPRFKTILSTMSKNDCLVTKKIEEVATGPFYKATRYSRNGQNGTQLKLIPLRYIKDLQGNLVPLDTKRYGGYSYENVANCIVIKCTKKNRKVEYKMINVSLMDYTIQQTNENYLVDKLNREHNVRYAKIEIINPLIPKNQLVTLNGQWVYVVSCREYNNAVQLVLDNKYDSLLYFISNYSFSGKSGDIECIRNSELRDCYNGLKHNKSLVDELIRHYISKINKLMPLYKITIGERELNEILNKHTWNEKCNFVKEFMKATKCSGTKTDALKEIVGVGAYGRIRDKALDLKTARFKYTSITGLYSTDINLLKKR